MLLTLQSMQDVTLGPFLVVSGLLVVSGAFKVVSPAGVAGALGAMGTQISRLGGRVIGVGEMALGTAAVVVPGRIPAASVAVAYVGLAGVVLVLRHRGAATCGCFGQISSPPSMTHVVFNLAAAATAALHLAAGGTVAIEDVGEGVPGGWPILALMATIGIGAALTLLTRLPAVLEETAQARRAAENRHLREHGTETALGTPARAS